MAIQLPQLNSCCCGCNLKTGSLVIGILFVVEAFCSMVLYSSQADTVYQDYSVESDAKEMRGILIYMAVLNAGMTVANVLLIVGVTKERPSFIFPWIVVYSFLVAIKGLGFLILALTMLMLSSYNVAGGVIVLIGGSINIGIYGYCILVVLSFHRSLTGTAPGTY